MGDEERKRGDLIGKGRHSPRRISPRGKMISKGNWKKTALESRCERPKVGWLGPGGSGHENGG